MPTRGGEARGARANDVGIEAVADGSPRLEMARAERHRQQLGHGHRRRRAGCAQHVDRHVAPRELGEALPAAAAGRTGLDPAADHQRLDDPGLARGHHVADGGGFGALALRVGGVLDVAADIDATTGAA